MLALDIGEKRVGVAVSDASGCIATPVKVLDASALIGAMKPLRTLAEEYEPELVLVGLPLSLDGTEGPQAIRARAAGDAIRDALGLPVDFADERLSSAQASRAMAEDGLSEKQRRGRLDAAAAALFLQAWLDARRPGDAGTARG